MTPLVDYRAELRAWLDASQQERAPRYDTPGTLDDRVAQMQRVTGLLDEAGWMQLGSPERVGGRGGPPMLRTELGAALAARSRATPHDAYGEAPHRDDEEEDERRSDVHCDPSRASESQGDTVRRAELRSCRARRPSRERTRVRRCPVLRDRSALQVPPAPADPAATLRALHQHDSP